MGSAARLDVGSCSNGGIGLAWISENSIWTEYFFLRHGDKIIFVGRFVAILRIFAAMLAGINRFPPWRFSLFNVSEGSRGQSYLERVGICWDTASAVPRDR